MNNQEVLNEEVVQEEATVTVTPLEKWRKIFYLVLTILTFVFAVFAFYAFNSGLVTVDRCVLSSAGLTEFLNAFIEYLDASDDFSTYTMVPSIIIIFFAVVYVVYSIIFTVSIIIVLVSFIKNLLSKEEAKVKYSKFSKKALVFASLPLAFIGAAYLLEDAVLTSLGVLYVVLAGIIFVAGFFGNKLFNEFAKEEKNWVDFGLDSGKFVVLCVIFILFFASFKKYNISTFMELIQSMNDADPTVENILAIVVASLQMVLVLQACKVFRAFIKFYVLNNGKKEVNGLMKKRTIFLMVYTVIIYAMAVYVKGLDDVFGSIMAYKDTFLLMLIGSVVILCALDYTEANKEKNVIRN